MGEAHPCVAQDGHKKTSDPPASRRLIHERKSRACVQERRASGLNRTADYNLAKKSTPMRRWGINTEGRHRNNRKKARDTRRVKNLAKRARANLPPGRLFVCASTQVTLTSNEPRPLSGKSRMRCFPSCRRTSDTTAVAAQESQKHTWNRTNINRSQT